jgi:glyoxylase I family protein
MTSSPTFERVLYVGLSVTDAQRSAGWYQDVLGFEVERDNLAESTRPSDWDEVLLRHPHSNVRIGLLRHATNDGEPFSELRTGLDHVEFEVASIGELDAWRRRLDTAGVPHSGARPHIVTFRDPDNIQLELYCERER